jgi:hypothetical protein
MQQRAATRSHESVEAVVCVSAPAAVRALRSSVARERRASASAACPFASFIWPCAGRGGVFAWAPIVARRAAPLPRPRPHSPWPAMIPARLFLRRVVCARAVAARPAVMQPPCERVRTHCGSGSGSSGTPHIAGAIDQRCTRGLDRGGQRLPASDGVFDLLGRLLRERNSGELGSAATAAGELRTARRRSRCTLLSLSASERACSCACRASAVALVTSRVCSCAFSASVSLATAAAETPMPCSWAACATPRMSRLRTGTPPTYQRVSLPFDLGGAVGVAPANTRLTAAPPPSPTWSPTWLRHVETR